MTNRMTKEFTRDQARQAQSGVGVRYVLGVSLTLVVMAFVFLAFVVT